VGDGDKKMPLNKSKGNMYPFVTHTWNPIKGLCPHGCSYCYMNKIYKRFGKTPAPLHLDENELQTDLGKDNFIFIGSSCDIFANTVPDEWLRRVLSHAAIFHGNRYLFQTKNPQRYISPFVLSPKRNILCTTLETNWYFPGITENVPRYFDRAEAMGKMSELRFKTMVTVEHSCLRVSRLFL
jgi:DNA repair photolyase